MAGGVAHKMTAVSMMLAAALVSCSCTSSSIRVATAASFLVAPSPKTISQLSSPMTLFLAKGLNSRNKQAELRRKMELAKQQKIQQQQQQTLDISSSAASVSAQPTPKVMMTDQEIKERNDRLRFEQLLQSESFKALNDFSSEGYLNRQQEEEEINAART